MEKDNKKSKRELEVEKLNAIKQYQEEKKQMKANVEDLEMKARYWEAQWKIRFYTLESEKLQPEYNEYLEAQAKIREEQKQAFLAQLEELKKKHAAGEPVGEDIPVDVLAEVDAPVETGNVV